MRRSGSHKVPTESVTLYTIITAHMNERRRRSSIGIGKLEHQAIIVGVVLSARGRVGEFATPGTGGLTGRLKVAT